MDIWTHFTYGELACALRLDALTNSHPIEVEVSSPDEIDEIFDTISYCKGSSLIHMIHAFLGDKAFRAGLCTYLAKHAYGNATTEDLWTALGTASGIDVASIMRPWTQQAGFPVVTVQPLSIQDGRLLVQLKQEQYRLPTMNTVCESDLICTILFLLLLSDPTLLVAMRFVNRVSVMPPLNHSSGLFRLYFPAGPRTTETTLCTNTSFIRLRKLFTFHLHGLPPVWTIVLWKSTQMRPGSIMYDIRRIKCRGL
ncbi:Puromycin-sensitive aminopeptidase [Fasciola gigantica]|uniref:Puromycin-sensitive aminopeptidase n=1 Tax=Fasciola gigantica TaxID=46835 RepID=A0A504Y7V0_FASGI|nr:Puromycin-sensitive aminopeptidase [Fasciola gigantica]